MIGMPSRIGKARPAFSLTSSLRARSQVSRSLVTGQTSSSSSFGSTGAGPAGFASRGVVSLIGILRSVPFAAIGRAAGFPHVHFLQGDQHFGSGGELQLRSASRREKVCKSV